MKKMKQTFKQYVEARTKQIASDLKKDAARRRERDLEYQQVAGQRRAKTWSKMPTQKDDRRISKKDLRNQF